MTSPIDKPACLHQPALGKRGSKPSIFEISGSRRIDICRVLSAAAPTPFSGRGRPYVLETLIKTSDAVIEEFRYFTTMHRRTYQHQRRHMHALGLGEPGARLRPSALSQLCGRTLRDCELCQNLLTANEPRCRRLKHFFPAFATRHKQMFSEGSPRVTARSPKTGYRTRERLSEVICCTP